MRLILLSLFACTLFSSCKSNRIDSLGDVLNAVSAPEQEITIDPAKDNLIKGEKGTNVFIPANAFVLKDGSLPDGKVTVTLRECYSVSDFIGQSLSTTSNGSLLETGGMINLQASAGGKEVEISKTKSIVIAFPNKDTTARMETFYGNRTDSGAMNWMPAFSRSEGSDASAIDSTLTDSSMYETKISVCGYVMISDNRDAGWKLKHEDSTISLYVEKNFPTNDSSITNALCARGLRVEMRLFINNAGKVTSVEFDKEYRDSIFTPDNIRKAMTSFLKSLPPFDLKSTRMSLADEDYFTGHGYYLDICCYKSLNWEEYNRRFKEKYSKYQDSAVKEMGPAAVNYYILSSTRLGWINCDRFYYDSREKTDFIVNLPGSAKGLAFITLDSIKSIMQGTEKDGSFVFKNIPVNSKVKVIGIAYQDGKTLLSKVPAVVTKQSFSLAGFREFSLNELKNELNN